MSILPLRLHNLKECADLLCWGSGAHIYPHRHTEAHMSGFLLQDHSFLTASAQEKKLFSPKRLGHLENALKILETHTSATFHDSEYNRASIILLWRFLIGNLQVFETEMEILIDDFKKISKKFSLLRMEWKIFISTCETFFITMLV